MKADPSITMESLLSDLPPVRAGEGYTVPELAEKTTVGEAKVRKAIKHALRAGTWRMVKVAREQIDGVTRRIPGYAPVKGKK